MNIMPIMPTNNKNRTQHKQSFGIRCKINDSSHYQEIAGILNKYTQNLPSDSFLIFIEKIDANGELGLISSRRGTQPVFKLTDDPENTKKMIAKVVSPILDTDNNSVKIPYNALPSDFVAAVKRLAKKAVKALDKEENRLFVPNKRLSQILKGYEAKYRQIEKYNMLEKGEPYSGIILSDPDSSILRIINSLPKNAPSIEAFLNAIDPKTGELAKIISKSGNPIRIKISNKEPVKYDTYGIACRIDTCSTSTGFSILNENPLESLLKNIKQRVDETVTFANKNKRQGQLSYKENIISKKEQDYRRGKIWNILDTRW